MRLQSIGLAICLVIFGCVSAAEIVPDQCTLTIQTPSLKERKTAKIRLDNGLEAYLISDPGAEQSAAALAVDVGSWQDPDSRPGQAHFTEHMLFLGNSTYPDEGAFRRFVDDHGGQANAYTAEEYTAYLFAINHSAFPEALDRLAHFVIDPLFTQSSMGREQMAVDQEFDRATEHDGWRELMVLSLLGNPLHPFSRFKAGNKNTLETITHDEELDWYTAHYSSSLMHLAVLSALPIDELRALVVERFSAVPDRGYKPFAVSGMRLAQETEAKLVVIEPHQDIRSLSLIWELPYDYKEDLSSASASLITRALGHEGEGSLAARLKEEGLVEEFSVGLLRSRKPHATSYLFVISADLTTNGLKRKEDVINRCFQAVHGLQQTGIPSYLHEETQQLAALKYAFQTRSAPYDAVSSLISGVVNEPLETFPQATVTAARYNPSAVQQVLTQFKPRTCHYSLVAPLKSQKLAATREEPWMKVPFTVVDIKEKDLRNWESATNHPAIALPPPNPFIPQALDLVFDVQELKAIPHPEVVRDDDWGQFYYANDQRFFVPQIAWQFTVKSAAINPGDTRDQVLLDLFSKSINERLTKLSYQAGLAGLGYGLSPTLGGVTLTISGYNDKAPLLFTKVLQAFVDGIPSVEAYERYVESLGRHYKNAAKEEPFVQAIATLGDILRQQNVPNAEKAKVVKKIEYRDLLLFFEAFREKTYVEGVLYGNLTNEEAQDAILTLRQTLQKEPFPEGRDVRPEIASLPPEKAPFLVSKRSKTQGNAIILAVQQGTFSPERRAAQLILGAGLEEPFFTELRTRQQTGYIVSSWDQELEQQLFQFFGVQSSSYSSQELLARFELFLERFLHNFPEQMPAERFDKVRESLVQQAHQLPKNPREMCSVLHRLAFARDGDFGWIDAIAAGLEELDYEQFCLLAQEFLGRENKQRLAVSVEGQLQPERALNYRQIRSLGKIKDIAVYHPRPQPVALP